jgi:serine palmitoyltransferase
MTAIGFYCLLFIGYINTLLFSPKTATERNRKGYAPLFNYFDKLYSNYVYRRVRDCWNRPICSVPADTIVIKNRFSPDNRWTFEFDGTTSECINLGSYNYLGFAQNKGPCAEDSIKAIQKYGIANLSPRIDLGKLRMNKLHVKTF